MGALRTCTVALVLVLAGCTSGSGDVGATDSGSVPAAAASPSLLDVIHDQPQPFSDLPAGRYAVDPDVDPATPLLVTFEVPGTGWQSWIGTAKFSEAGHVGLSITTVSTLVTDGCRNHAWLRPRPGPTVDDLVTALVHLAPFRVVSPPEVVSAYGYRGQHLRLTVPNLPVVDGVFTRCQDGKLKSWVAAIDTEPGDAFYGYTGPGYVEDFWVLDVDGTRLVLAAGRSPGSPQEDVEQLHDILASVRVEP